ncbi:hypothetical protein Bca4012_051980 [Brassica carinata]
MSSVSAHFSTPSKGWFTVHLKRIRFVELNKPVSPIPQERLRFHAHDSMYGLAYINTHLPDILQGLTHVKSIVCDVPQGKEHYALIILLEGFQGDPRVVVATINPKIVGVSNGETSQSCRLVSKELGTLQYLHCSGDTPRKLNSSVLARSLESRWTKGGATYPALAPAPSSGSKYGDVQTIQIVIVAELSAMNYQLSDSSMMIRFGESTSFDEITEPAIPIGVESFRFRDHSELLGLANTNTLLPGRLFLNATSGTHIYFDKETTAGETYFYRLVAQDTRLPSAAPLLKSYANVESLSIAELNEFIISASSQERRGSDTKSDGAEVIDGKLESHVPGKLEKQVRRLISSAPGRSLVSSWTRDCATFLAPTAPKAPNVSCSNCTKSSNALSQLSPGCIVLILMLLVSNHLYTSYLHSLMLVSTHIFNFEI